MERVFMTSPPPRGETYEQARAAWPELEVPAERFMQYAAERRAVQSPHLSDLYLACACAAGDARAIELLERDYLSKVQGVLRRQRRAPETIEEVCQSLRATLVGQG